MLARRAILGDPLGPPIRIDFQVRADGWRLDDALVLFNKSGLQTRWAVSVRSSRQITSAVNDDFLRAAWIDLRGENGSPFDASRDRLGMVTAPLGATVHTDLQELCRLSQDQHPRDLDRRMQVEAYVSKSKRRLWEALRPPEDIDLSFLSNSPGELLKRFKCIESNFRDESSQERIEALDCCKEIAVPPSSGQDLWNAILSEVASIRTSGGYLTQERLTKRLRNREISVADLAREDYIEQSRRASHARLLEGWLSLGVPPDIAERLVADSAVGSFPGSLPAEGLAVLVGDLGSGKSVIAERVHLSDLSIYEEGAQAFVPVFVRARHIRGALTRDIEEKISSMPRVMRRPVRLVLDGLDEVGATQANELLREARELIHSNFCARILVTSRPGPDVRDDERFAAPPLSTERLNDLSYLLTGRQYSWYGVPAPIREATQFPLFAIIAMLQSRNAQELPASKSLLIDLLVRRALGDHEGTTMQHSRPLAEAAASCIMGDGHISHWDLDGPAVAAELLTTRLVVREGNGYRFALPIFEQYFGAYALLDGTVSIDHILESLESFERWRYSFVVAVGIGPWNTTASIIESLGMVWPGAACWVIDQAISKHMMSGQAHGRLPDGTTCAVHIQRALATTVSWFFPCLRHSNLLDRDNSLPAVGALVVDQQSLIVSLHYDDDYADAGIVPLDSYPDPISVGDNPKIRFIQHSTAVWEQDAWPWRWALDLVSDAVSTQLEQLQLPLTEIDTLRSEREWAIIRGLLGSRISRYSEADPSEVVSIGNTILPDKSDEMADPFNIFDLGILCFEWEIREIVDRARTPESRLSYPWPGPDCDMINTTHIGGRYSTERKCLLTENVYQSAIEAYAEIVERYFPKFKPTMRLASLLPLSFDILLKEETGKDRMYGAVISLRQELLHCREETKVTVTPVDDEGFNGHGHGLANLAPEADQQKRLRPASIGWSHPWRQTSVLDIFGDCPATHTAMRWLVEDLQALGL